MGDRAGPTVTSTTNQDPWGAQQGPLRYGFDQAAYQYENPPLYYPYSTVTPFAPETTEALSMAGNRARTGNPLIQQGQGQVSDTLAGDYLGANPHLDQMMDYAGSGIRRNLDSQFNRAGGYGSGGHEQASAEALAREAGNIYGRAYENERSRQFQAAPMVGPMAGLDYADIAQLGQVGAAREGQAGAVLADDISRWNFGQNQPADQLSRYMANVSGGYGGQTTSAQPTFTNPATGALGGAAMGAGIAGSLPAGSPWMWPLIAGGGLLGAF